MDARGDAHQHAFFALLDGTDRTHLVASTLLASAGHALCTTVDAGPNVHVIGTQNELDFALPALKALPGVMDVIVARPGAGAGLI